LVYKAVVVSKCKKPVIRFRDTPVPSTGKSLLSFEDVSQRVSRRLRYSTNHLTGCIGGIVINDDDFPGSWALIARMNQMA
jgi:hypothetical protein